MFLLEQRITCIEQLARWSDNNIIILQNKGHITALKENLRFPNIPFYSLIVFYGTCELKDIKLLPVHTYVIKIEKIFDTINQILTNHKTVEYDKDSIRVLLSESVENGDNQDIVNQHSDDVQKLIEEEI